jgi:hypothetical protein
MARKKEIEWVSGKEAAQIMTDNTDHVVQDAYVRLLAKKGKIRSRPVNKREKEYHKGDVEAYIVERRSEKSCEAFKNEVKS